MLLQENSISVYPVMDLPAKSAAAQFIDSVNEQLKKFSDPGSTLKIKYPPLRQRIDVEAPQKIYALNDNSRPLQRYYSSAWMRLIDRFLRQYPRLHRTTGASLDGRVDGYGRNIASKITLESPS